MIGSLDASRTGRPAPAGQAILPWAAFHLLCVWMRTTPGGASRLLGWPDRPGTGSADWDVDAWGA